MLISSCLIVSVLSSYLSWTLYATEIPHMGARNGAFPKSFIPLNKNEVPQGSLMFTTLTVQVCLLLVWLKGEDYSALLMVSTSMILIPYLLIGAYLFKLSLTQKGCGENTALSARQQRFMRLGLSMRQARNICCFQSCSICQAYCCFSIRKRNTTEVVSSTVWKSRIGIAVDFGRAGRTAVCR